jgi:CubicO group peptidase (beta-lactamase class C family)
LAKEPFVKPVSPGSTLLVLVSSMWLCGETRGQDETSKLEQYMDACVQVRHFSGSVLVIRDGMPVFSKGYGLANVEHGVANTPQTKFRLGSITKQFTAMAILILQERGKLAVEDPIGKYFDDPPKAWEGVTIHNLLTHTSGIHSYTSEPDYVKKMAQPETVRSMIARFRDKPLDFKPGEKFQYSNSGYFLLGAIIEKVSGQSYEAFLKEAIFKPLDMTDSGYDHPSSILSHRASGYTRKADVLENAEYLDMAQPYAAGSLYSTTLDLAKWDRAVGDCALINKESTTRMFTPEKNNYAYGWSVTTRSDRKEIGHGGGINGFVTDIVRYPDQKVCVVVLSNVVPANPGKVARDLAAIAFGEAVALPKVRTVARVVPELFDAYVGRYELIPDRVMTITREGDHLFAQPTGQPKLEFFPESETAFFSKVVDAQITFVKDDMGKVTHIVLNQGDRETKAKRLDGNEPGRRATDMPE